jgi:hypothetical protein
MYHNADGAAALHCIAWRGSLFIPHCSSQSSDPSICPCILKGGMAAAAAAAPVGSWGCSTTPPESCDCNATWRRKGVRWTTACNRGCVHAPCPCVTNPTPPHFSGHSFSSFGSHFSGHSFSSFASHFSGHSFSSFGSGGMFTPEITTGSSNTGSVKLVSFSYLLSTCYCSTAHAAHRSTPCIAI